MILQRIAQLVSITVVVTGAISSARAQRAAEPLHGVVYDSLSDTPIPGAVVSVLAGHGASIGRALSDAHGQFTLAISDNVARLHIVRIGFHPVDLVLSSAPRASLVVRMVALPSLLSTVRAVESPTCRRRADSDDALALWEQARAALLASVAARDQEPGTIQLLQYRRVLRGAQASVVDQQVQRQYVAGARPFSAMHSAADYARDGYLIKRPTDRDESELDAPDADVLLDDSFAATHCFAVAPTADTALAEVGLTFEPAPGRDRLVDVRGMLRIDKRAPALTSITLTYTNLPRTADEPDAGASMNFRTLPNGVTFIDRWTITSPDPSSPDRRALLSGGQVVSADWSDGTHWDGALPTIRGRLANAAHDTSARVWLDGTTDTATVDSAGSFEFSHVLPGRYLMRAAAGDLAQGGIPQTVERDSADAARDTAAVRPLRLAGADATLAALCHTTNTPAAILFVRVADTFEWTIPDQRVVASWRDPHGRKVDATTGADGRALFCDVPRDRHIQLTVGPDDAPLASDVAEFSPGQRILLVTLHVAGRGSD